VVILDDVLAAVDAEVGAYIFEHMLLGALKNRTRIIVTNNLDLLHKVDRIAVLDKGNMVELASRQELLDRPDSFLNTLLAQMSKRDLLTEKRPPATLLQQHSVPVMSAATPRVPMLLMAQSSAAGLFSFCPISFFV